MNTEKKRMRDWAKSLNFNPEISQQYCAEIVRFFKEMVLHETKKYLVSYSSKVDEVDLSHLSLDYQALTRMGEGISLSVHPASSELEHSKYGFLEPVDGSPFLFPADIKCVLVPGVVFSERGSRLGRGMGYYDSFLKSLQPDTVIIGIVKSINHLLPEIPVEIHDVAMTHLLTPDGILVCK